MGQSDISTESTNLAGIRHELGLSQSEFAKKLGVTRTHLAKLEAGRHGLSPRVKSRLGAIVGLRNADRVRAIPVRSWAQAGAGIDYEELPLSWQEVHVATDCPDMTAVAVEIQGDSMEPKFYAGDVAVLMPEHQPRNGSLVVARLENEGTVFKVYSRQGRAPGMLTLTSYNPTYPPIEATDDAIHWVFPVYQVIRKVWSR